MLRLCKCFGPAVAPATHAAEEPSVGKVSIPATFTLSEQGTPQGTPELLRKSSTYEAVKQEPGFPTSPITKALREQYDSPAAETPKQVSPTSIKKKTLNFGKPPEPKPNSTKGLAQKYEQVASPTVVSPPAKSTSWVQSGGIYQKNKKPSSLPPKKSIDDLP